MSRVTVLGGGGAVGSIATKTLASSGVFSDITVADINMAAARKTIGEAEGAKVTAVELDAESPESIKKAIAGSAVVLNCVGPFYRYAPVILKAVIEAGKDYVDVCDDFDATEALLAMNEQAKKAGISYRDVILDTLPDFWGIIWLGESNVADFDIIGKLRNYACSSYKRLIDHTKEKNPFDYKPLQERMVFTEPKREIPIFKSIGLSVPVESQAAFFSVMVSGV